MTTRKPKRGEIWQVSFEPQVGTEIKKARPAIIMTITAMNALPTRIVVPIRNYKDTHDRRFYFIPIEPNSTNGLSKKSTIDCSQVKSFDISRFQRKIGKLSKEELEEVSDTVSRCIGYV